MATPPPKLPIQDDQKAWNFFVFRKKRNLLPVATLVSELLSHLEGLAVGVGSGLDGLVRAGELETAFADGSLPGEALVSSVTDLVAAHVCGQPVNLQTAISILQQAAVSGQVGCSHPEGFAYYGLNPLDYGACAKSLAAELRPEAAVIGVRSVGSVLGAVVAVGLRESGINVDRITVRPEGEPYRRLTRFSAIELRWIRHKLERFADFVIVDEGPGFSGSTLLSVGRALQDAGVPPGNIRIICSRPVDELQDSSTARELGQFKPAVVRYGRRIPAESDRNIGGGLWREMLYPDPSQWPACWTDLERIKHLSLDSASIYKFEGFGRFGALARHQAEELADAGFSPALLGYEDGFARYCLVRGHPLNLEDLSQPLLERMASYCAFRASLFRADSPTTEPLLNMMRRNLAIEFDCEAPVTELPVSRPVYADCRMMPHEWLQAADGRVLKTDSVGHAEGHQLPGPVDIAWDLAGAIVEWDLPRTGTEFFLASYQSESGDDAATRIHAYIRAYLVYRMAYCRMGAASMQNLRDGSLLWNQYQRYAAKLRGILNITL
jgi:hypothetical protein